MVTAFGALKLFGSCAQVPVKSIVALRAARDRRVIAHRGSRAPLSSGSVKCAVLERGDHAAHRTPRRCPARGACRRATVSSPNCATIALQLLHALLVGGDLRAQVGEVLLRVARRVARRAPSSAQQLGLAQRAVARTSLKLSISTPSSSMRRRERRHRAGRDAADVGVVAARGDVEQHGCVAGVVQNTGVTTVTSGRCVPPL